MKTLFNFKWLTAIAAILLLGLGGAGVSEAQDCPESVFGPSTCSPVDTVAVTGDKHDIVGGGDSIIIGDQLVVTMDLDPNCTISEFHLAAYPNQAALDDDLNGGGGYAVGANAQASSTPDASSATLAVPLPEGAGEAGVCVAHAAATCNGEDISVTLGETPINPNKKNWKTSFPCGTLCALDLTCSATQGQDGPAGPTDLLAEAENVSNMTLNPFIALGVELNCDGFDNQGMVFNAFNVQTLVTGAGGFSAFTPIVDGIFTADNPLIAALMGSFLPLPPTTEFPGEIIAMLAQADEDLFCQWSCFAADEVTSFSVINGKITVTNTGDLVTSSTCFDVTGTGGGQEICDDGLDNDGDGLVDCFDGDCATDPNCGVS